MTSIVKGYLILEFIFNFEPFEIIDCSAFYLLDSLSHKGGLISYSKRLRVNDFAHFFEDGRKLKIHYEIKPSL